MKEFITPLGILLIFSGFALVVIGSLLSSQKSNAKVAAGGFVGPIPFGFANSPQLLWIVIGITILMIFLNFMRLPK